jgi:hypothetical protein
MPQGAFFFLSCAALFLPASQTIFSIAACIATGVVKQTLPLVSHSQKRVSTSDLYRPINNKEDDYSSGRDQGCGFQVIAFVFCIPLLGHEFLQSVFPEPVLVEST